MSWRSARRWQTEATAVSARKRKGPLAQSAAAAAAVLRAAGHAPPAPDVMRADGELLLGGGGYVDLKDRVTQRFALACVEFSRRSVGLVPTEFLPHGVAVDPLHPTRVVAFEKIGPGCCEIDLAGGELTRSIAPTEGRWFYGHGAFSPDGRLLYSTETVNGVERGVIGVRDAATLEYLAGFDRPSVRARGPDACADLGDVLRQRLDRHQSAGITQCLPEELRQAADVRPDVGDDLPAQRDVVGVPPLLSVHLTLRRLS